MPLPAIVGGRERQVAGERQACGLQANQRVANDLTKKIKHAQGVITLKKETTLVFAAVGVLAVLAAGCQRKGGEAEPVALVSTDRYAGYEAVVVETHRESLALRQKVLRDTVDADSYWIKGNWGETIWSLAALYLNEKTDRANAWLLGSAQAYCDAMKAEAGDGVFAPGKFSGESPWAYFALTDYVRILCLFRTDSPHHPELFSSAAPSRGQRRPSGRDGPGLPGDRQARLKPETEAAMKEALWWLVKSKSRVAEASLDHLLVHHGTENHDLTLRPNYYLVASVLKDDPAFKDRRYDDGHTVAEHFAAYNTYFQEWPRMRAKIGLWFEMGSDTYQKYSWPALFNLHELSPDPVVRKRFGMLLDIAFVEEAQVSFRGRRGGGRSRAGFGKNNFEGYKNLLYAPEGVGAGSSHSKVIETSTYQVPAAAIVLRKMAFPADEPFLIANRVPGEIAVQDVRKYADKSDTRNPYTVDSALINHAYRTPHYLLGSTLQNPALSMPSPDGGQPTIKYSGISRQNRWSGMIFTDPETRWPKTGKNIERADNELCAVYPVIEKTRGGRPQHPHWSFQHENVLFLQRIAPGRDGMGSYSTGPISIRFQGKGLQKVEENGWIFASNGKAFVGVKFLDGGYEWDETGELAGPANHSADSTTRFLVHAGEKNPPLTPPRRGTGHGETPSRRGTDLPLTPLRRGTDLPKGRMEDPLLGGVGVGSAGDAFAAFRASVLANPLVVEPDRVVYRASDGPELECFRYDHHNFEDFKLPRVDGKAINLRPPWTYRSPYLNGKFSDDKVSVTVGPIRQVYDFGNTTVDVLER